MRNVSNSAGFSLTELMVVFGIIAALALIAIPQYNKFTARARQAEAKTTLATIHKLQHSYQLEKERYAAWADSGHAYGYKTEGADNVCTEADTATTYTTDHRWKALGLRLEGCENLRYRYFVLREDNTDGNEYFHAIAVAYSDDSKRIYPRCDGTVSTAVVAKHVGKPAFTDLHSSQSVGDVQGITEEKRWVHHKDIIHACE